MTFTSADTKVYVHRPFRTGDDVEDDDAGLEKWRDIYH